MRLLPYSLVLPTVSPPKLRVRVTAINASAMEVFGASVGPSRVVWMGEHILARSSDTTLAAIAAQPVAERMQA